MRYFHRLPKSKIRKNLQYSSTQRSCPSGFDLERLADASDGFSGAEIEQVIVSGLYSAQAQDIVANTEILLEETERTRPLSVVMAEKIDQLRNWAEERTVPAD